MQADLRAKLRADLGDLVAVVAWSIRPQSSAIPAIVLTVISEPIRYAYSGPDSLTQTRVQADIYASDALSALAVNDALVASVSGYAGTVGATKFEGIFLVSRFDELAEQTVGAPLHRISRDLMVNHKEA